MSGNSCHCRVREERASPTEELGRGVCGSVSILLRELVRVLLAPLSVLLHCAGHGMQLWRLDQVAASG